MVKLSRAISRGLCQAAAFANSRSKLAWVCAAKSGVVEAEDLGADPGGMGGVGRLVALAAMRRRREVGAVGLHQDAVDRGGGEDLAQLAGFREGGDAGHRQVEAEIERRARPAPARRKSSA